MGSEIDTTGVVTKISGDSCNVSITIDNAQKTFSCSKLLVYVCGYQCEGQLTALLDEGADVEVRYKLCKENVPFIVAVWCGEVPDHLSNGSRKLRPCYDQKGHVVGVRSDSFLVQNDDGDHNVLINKEVIFRDGRRVKNGSDLFSVNEYVTFDAIPFEIEHPSGTLYQATCAWVGQTPRLCERFGLQALTLLDDLWDDGSSADLVHGVVSVIPNEVVAFAEAEFAQNSSKVLLMRSSFARGCSNIKYMVNVGDKLCMQVRFGFMFRNARQWFAVQAWKDGGEILDEVKDGSSCKAGPTVEDASSEVKKAEDVKGSAGSVAKVAPVRDEELDLSDLVADWLLGQDSSAPTPVRKPTRRRNRRRENANDPVETKTSTETEKSSTESVQGKLGVNFDENSPFLKANPPLSGAISIVAKDAAFILYHGLKVAVDREALFHNGKPCSEAQFVLLLTTEIREVNFEAVKTSQSKYIKLGFSHRATCVWVGQKPSVSNVRWERAILSLKNLNRDQRKIPNVAPQTAQVKFDKTSPVLFHDPPLLGIVTDVSQHCASIAYNDLNVYVSYQDCFSDLQCKESELSEVLSISQVIYFEAVKTDNRDGYSHEATCVWISAKPSLSAFTKTLPPMKFSLLEEKERRLVGIVRRLCLPKVALVVVDDEPTTVCLHVSAFGCESKKTVDYASGKDFINQFVKLGDAVRFKVLRVPSFFNVLSATDVEVLGSVSPKTSSSDNLYRLDADASSSSFMSELDRITSKVEISGKEMREDILTSDVGPLPSPTERCSVHDREGPSRLKISDDEEKRRKTVCDLSPEKVIPPLKKTSGIVYKAVPFRRLRPSMTQTWHIECSGRLDVDTNLKVVKLPPTGFSVDYTDNKNHSLRALTYPMPVDEVMLLLYQGEVMCFDATEKDGRTCVNRLWAKAKGTECPTFVSAMYLASLTPLKEALPLDLPQRCRCKIVSIPSHDVAIGEVLERFRVSITLQSLVTEEDMNFTLSSIDAFLNVGDDVCVAIMPSRCAGGTKYLEAETCWKVVKLNDTDSDDQVQETVDRKRKSWSDMWLDGGLFIEGILRKRADDEYYVVGMEDVAMCRYDVPRKNFWVHKKQTEPSDNFVGEQLTFHIPRDGGKSQHVPLAWIGETPTAVDILKDRYSVPHGVVSSNSLYEGIIEDFLLPTRALCRIGAAPVLVVIGGVRRHKFIKGYFEGGNFVKGLFIENDNVDLVTGTRVSMRVLWDPDSCCIESHQTLPLKRSADVVVNLRGTVTSLPQPVGTIRATSAGLGDIVATFELASVQIPEGMSLHQDGVCRWFEFLKDFITVGMPVHLTAMKSPALQRSHRAVRVWVDDVQVF